MKHWQIVVASGLLGILAACGGTPGGTNPPPPPPPPGAPVAPSNFQATATSSTSIRLTFTAPSGATGYILERKTGAGSYAAITPPTASPYDDAGLTASTKYDYRLKATNASGSSPTVEASATTQAGTNPPPPPPPPGAPAAPTNLVATATSSSAIQLSWTAPSGATGYVLERKSGAGSYAAITPPAANATSYNDAGLTASTQYDYRLKATNASGDSPFATASATTQATGGTVVSRIGSVTVAETTTLAGPSVNASATFMGFNQNLPAPPTGLYPNTGTCVVSTGGAPTSIAPPDPSGGLTFTSLDAGPQITLKNASSTYATLNKETLNGNIAYSSGSTSLPALPASLSVDIPGATGGFPAFSNLAMPAIPADFNFIPNPAGTVNKDTTFNWTNPAGAPNQLVFSGVQLDLANPSSSKIFICFAPDTGSFAFPTQTKNDLQAAGVTAAQMYLAQRSNSRVETQGSTHVLLTAMRTKSLLTVP